MRRWTNLVSMAALVFFLVPAATFAGPRHHRASDNAFQFRIGGIFLEGDGDLWRDNAEVFTLGASDFDDVSLGFSFIKAYNNNFEVGLNADFFDATVLSQYREFVDEDGFPIFHDTGLEMVPITVDFRFLPFGRHRGRGLQVNKPVFYVGAGVGVNLWQYEEIGDFIDFDLVDPEVFFDRFSDDGVAWESHILAGVELPIGPSFNLLLEGRRSWSDDELGGDFAGFGKLNMDTTSVMIGGSWRF